MKKQFFRGVTLFHRVAIQVEDTWLLVTLMNEDYASGGAYFLGQIFGLSPHHIWLLVHAYQWLRGVAFLYLVWVTGLKRMHPAYAQDMSEWPKRVCWAVKTLIDMCQSFFKKK